MKLLSVGERLVCKEYVVKEEKSSNPLVRSQGLDSNLICGKIIEGGGIMGLQDGTVLFFRKDSSTPIRNNYIVKIEDVLCIVNEGE